MLHVVDGDAENEKDHVVQEQVQEQIQRLLNARDQKAFSRFLIDSVCSMANDDFHRVREKLIRKFINDATSCVDGVQLDEMKLKTAAAEDDVVQTDDVNSSALSLRIVNVRSFGGKDADDGSSWLNDSESPSAGDEPTVKQERADSSSHQLADAVSVDDDFTEDATMSNLITIVPIDSTSDVANNCDNSPVEHNHDDETHRNYSVVNEATQTAAAFRFILIFINFLSWHIQ